LDNSGIVEELRAVAFEPSTHILEGEHV